MLRDVLYQLLVFVLVVVFVFVGIPKAFIEWINWKRRHE